MVRIKKCVPREKGPRYARRELVIESDSDEIDHRLVTLVLECGERKITLENVDVATVEFDYVVEEACKMAVPEGATLNKNCVSIENGVDPNHMFVTCQNDLDCLFSNRTDALTFLLKVTVLSGNHMEDEVIAEDAVHAEDGVVDDVMKWIEDNFGEGVELNVNTTGNDELKEDAGSAVEREKEEVVIGKQQNEVEVEQEVSEESHFEVESEEEEDEVEVEQEDEEEEDDSDDEEYVVSDEKVEDDEDEAEAGDVNEGPVDEDCNSEVPDFVVPNDPLAIPEFEVGK